MWKSEDNLWKLILLPNILVRGLKLQVIRPRDKHFSCQSNLPGLCHFLSSLSDLDAGFQFETFITELGEVFSLV